MTTPLKKIGTGTGGKIKEPLKRVIIQRGLFTNLRSFPLEENKGLKKLEWKKNFKGAQRNFKREIPSPKK